MARMALVLLLVAASLGGCGGHPKPVPLPESGIELRWPNGAVRVEDAQKDADARCAAAGRHAVLVGETSDGAMTIARFACR